MNEEVRARTHHDQASLLIEKSCPRWYGHLLHFLPNHLTLQGLNFNQADISWKRLEESQDAAGET